MGTVIKTNITSQTDDAPSGSEEGTGFFHLIEQAHIQRKNGIDGGRILWAEIQISEWIFNSIRRKSVLTLHRDYFRLRKPIERRVYEIARKLCGAKERQEIRLEKLLKRTGARTELKRFRHTIREITETDHLPDYLVGFDEDRDVVTFTGRGTILSTEKAMRPALPSLDPETYMHARAAAPGWDIHMLEAEWRDWVKAVPRNADAAFIGFCRMVYENRGPA